LKDNVAAPNTALSAAVWASGRDHLRSRLGAGSPVTAFARRVISILNLMLPAIAFNLIGLRCGLLRANCPMGHISSAS
jgi:hypothetical protein